MTTSHKKLIIAVFISLAVAETYSTACQRLSTVALKKKLLAVGGTLNPNLVAVDKKGTARFKPHFRNKHVNRVTSIVNDEIDEDMEDGDAAELYDDVKYRRGRLRSRERRSTTLGTCYSPGTPVNGRYILCHMCDSTTVLSTEYFPRYINEVICNPNEQKTCFQGQGECTSNAVPTIFLKKSGQCTTNSNGILMEEWNPVTINIRTCCECRLYPGSYLIPISV